MHSLILTVLSIALLGSVTFATLQYLPADLEIAQDIEQEVKEGFSSLEASWEGYRRANQTFKWNCETTTGSTGETFEDCNRVVDNPGYLPSASWEASLFTQYGFKPATPNNGTWSYSNNGAGDIYFCLSGSFTGPTIKGLNRVNDDLPPNQFIINSSCGIKSDANIADDHSGPVAVTFWIKQA